MSVNQVQTTVLPNQEHLRTTAVECTHCHQLIRLSDVPFRYVPVQEMCETSPIKQPLSPAPLSPDGSVTDTDEPSKGDEASKWRWSQELKDHFVRAFDTLQSRGIHATPKKIMNLMTQNGAPVGQLTMRRVQSHHQKYLKRLKNQKAGSKKAQKVIRCETAYKSRDSAETPDMEVSRIMAGQTGGSCNSSPRGSPLLFNGAPDTPATALPFIRVLPKGAPIQPVRAQSAPPSMSAHLPSNFLPIDPAVPMKFHQESFTVASWSGFALDGSVAKPSGSSPQGSSRALTQSAPCILSRDSFGESESAPLFGGLEDQTFTMENSILDGLSLPPVLPDVGFGRLDDVFGTESYSSSSDEEGSPVDLLDIMQHSDSLA